MTKTTSSIKSFFIGQWREAVLSVISITVGVFAESILREIDPSLFEAANLLRVTFVIITILFFATAVFSLSMWRTTNRQLTAVESDTNSLANSIGTRVQLVSAAKGYKTLQKWIQNAKSEVLILSNYVFDWENGKPIFDSEIIDSPERSALYSTINAKLASESKRSKDFKFIRIVQIPQGHRLEEIFPFDSYYRETSKLIIEKGRSQPEFASLRTSEPIFTNTFGVIDRSYLYLEFNAFKLNVKQAFSPFVILIEDPNSEIVQSMVRLYQRIEANSTIVK